jgi:hypothetical protein
MLKQSKRSLFTYLTVATLLALSFSCKGPRKITDTTPVSGCQLKSRGKDSLLTLLKKNQLDYQWMTAKMNASVTGTDSTEQTFTINLRARKDSAIWLSVSKLGIEGARVLVTRDSVKLVQHLPENKYFKGDYAYLNKLLQAELDFEMLQSVLIGNSVEFYEDERYRLNVDNQSCQYQLSTIRKRKLRKVIQGNKEMKDPVQSIWLKPDDHKIARILFFDFDPNRTFEAHFDKFEAVDSTQRMPMLIKYDIKAEGEPGKEKKVTINLEYSKVTLNKPQTFPFNIPSSYEQITTTKEKDK